MRISIDVVNNILNLLFTVIVIVEVDKLTRDAQHGLRRTMEKYVGSCRLILCCNSTSRVIPAIRSRCLAIRVAAPTVDEVRSKKNLIFDRQIFV